MCIVGAVYIEYSIIARAPLLFILCVCLLIYVIFLATMWWQMVSGDSLEVVKFWCWFGYGCGSRIFFFYFTIVNIIGDGYFIRYIVTHQTATLYVCGHEYTTFARRSVQMRHNQKSTIYLGTVFSFPRPFTSVPPLPQTNFTAETVTEALWWCPVGSGKHKVFNRAQNWVSVNDSLHYGQSVQWVPQQRTRHWETSSSVSCQSDSWNCQVLSLVVLAVDLVN